MISQIKTEPISSWFGFQSFAEQCRTVCAVTSTKSWLFFIYESKSHTTHICNKNPQQNQLQQENQKGYSQLLNTSSVKRTVQTFSSGFRSSGAFASAKGLFFNSGILSISLLRQNHVQESCFQKEKGKIQTPHFENQTRKSNPCQKTKSQLKP